MRDTIKQSSNTEFTARKLAKIDQAAVDQQLSPLEFRLLWLLASAADSKTGIARRKQADLAEKLGIHRRTVQRCRDRLVNLGYLNPLGHKPGNVSAYNVGMPRKAALVPPVDEVGGVGAACDNGDAAQVPPAGGAGIPNRRPANRTNLSLSSPQKNFPCAPPPETEGGGPSQRADALGPLGSLDTDLREHLGEKIEWLSMAKLVERTGDTVTLSVLNAYQGDNIRKHCGPIILAVTGAAELKFVVEAPVDAPKTPVRP